VHNELTYLDNASTSWPKAPAVGPAMLDAIDRPVGNPGRGQHRASKQAGEATLRLRTVVASSINAPTPDRICLSSGSTASLNMAILGLLWYEPKPAGKRPIVVTTVLEHNAVRRPLKHHERDGVCEIVEIGCSPDGFVDPEEVIAAAADERCAAVAMTMCSNVIGTAQPVEAIGRGLRERAPHALFFIDGAQAMNALPIDVDAMGIDVLAFSGHKAMLGPGGTGGMFISDRAYTASGAAGEGGPVRPTHFGGTGGTLAGSIEDFNPSALPGVFEVGTGNVVGRAGLLAAIEDDRVPSQQAGLDHERRLIAMFIDRFAGDERVTLFGPLGVERRHGVVTFNIKGYSPQEVSTYLDTEWGIAVRAGLHCAPAAHKALGTLDTGGAVRASPGPFSKDEEMAKLIEAIDKLLDG
jgi:cysteine desulfurase/selenocysteine lyase